MTLLKSIVLMSSLIISLPLQASYPYFKIEHHGSLNLQISPDRKFLVATSSNPQLVNIYNLETAQLYAIIQEQCGFYSPEIFFSSDSNNLFIMRFGEIYRYEITQDGVSPLIETITPSREKSYISFDDPDREAEFGTFGKTMYNEQTIIKGNSCSYAAIVQTEDKSVHFFKINRSAFFYKDDGFAYCFPEKDFFITTRLPDQTITSQPISIDFPCGTEITPYSGGVISSDATQCALVFSVEKKFLNHIYYERYIRIVDLKSRSVLYECPITKSELCSINFSSDNSKLLIAWNECDRWSKCSSNKFCFYVIDLITKTGKRFDFEKSYVGYAAFVTNTKILVSRCCCMNDASIEYIDLPE